MSWSNNKANYLIMMAGALAVTACGFKPMYSSHPSEPGEKTLPAGQQLAGIAVQPVAGRWGQQFHNDLEDRLNPGNILGDARPYRLNAGLETLEQPIAISRDGTISRYNVVVTTALSLERVSDGAVIYRSTVRRTGSYNNVSNAFYSTYVASQDAIRRAVTELAEDVRLRLGTFFAQNPNPQPLSPASVQAPNATDEMVAPPPPLPNYDPRY